MQPSYSFEWEQTSSTLEVQTQGHLAKKLNWLNFWCNTTSSKNKIHANTLSWWIYVLGALCLYCIPCNPRDKRQNSCYRGNFSELENFIFCITAGLISVRSFQDLILVSNTLGNTFLHRTRDDDFVPASLTAQVQNLYQCPNRYLTTILRL